MPSSRGSSRRKDQIDFSSLSCTGRQALHHSITWDSHLLQHVVLVSVPFNSGRTFLCVVIEHGGASFIYEGAFSQLVAEEQGHSAAVRGPGADARADNGQGLRAECPHQVHGGSASTPPGDLGGTRPSGAEAPEAPQTASPRPR